MKSAFLLMVIFYVFNLYGGEEFDCEPLLSGSQTHDFRVSEAKKFKSFISELKVRFEQYYSEDDLILVISELSSIRVLDVDRLGLPFGYFSNETFGAFKILFLAWNKLTDEESEKKALYKIIRFFEGNRYLLDSPFVLHDYSQFLNDIEMARRANPLVFQHFYSDVVRKIAFDERHRIESGVFFRDDEIFETSDQKRIRQWIPFLNRSELDLNEKEQLAYNIVMRGLRNRAHDIQLEVYNNLLNTSKLPDKYLNLYIEGLEISHVYELYRLEVFGFNKSEKVINNILYSGWEFKSNDKMLSIYYPKMEPHKSARQLTS